MYSLAPASAESHWMEVTVALCGRKQRGSETAISPPSPLRHPTIEHSSVAHPGTNKLECHYRTIPVRPLCRRGVSLYLCTKTYHLCFMFHASFAEFFQTRCRVRKFYQEYFMIFRFFLCIFRVYDVQRDHLMSRVATAQAIFNQSCKLSHLASPLILSCRGSCVGIMFIPADVFKGDKGTTTSSSWLVHELEAAKNLTSREARHMRKCFTLYLLVDLIFMSA